MITQKNQMKVLHHPLGIARHGQNPRLENTADFTAQAGGSVRMRLRNPAAGK